MSASPSRQPSADSSAEALGARRYEYRYPTASRLIALGFLLLIPVVIGLFLRLVLQPASFNDRLVPAVMAIILILCAAFLTYRQAYFAWTTFTIYEGGLRLRFWRKHLVIPWSNLGKLYLAPGRMPRWQIVDRNEHLLCELRTSAVGRVVSESDAPNQAQAPKITDAIIEQANLTLYEKPFRHYAPAPKDSRPKKKAK